MVLHIDNGGVVERLNTPVLETGKPPGFVGSNPIPAAIFAAIREVNASLIALNNTAEAMKSKPTKLYAFVVLIPRGDSTR